MSGTQGSERHFEFFLRPHLQELTGLKARSVEELAMHLKTVSGSVIYHHTHRYLQQHQYLLPEPPNDFAYWVSHVLQERKLGEQLASINTCDFSSLRSLREKIIATLEEYLHKTKDAPRMAHEGEEFYFIKSISFILPSGYKVATLEEFLDSLKKVTIDSIYFHMFESKLRLEKGSNDFSVWFEDALGEKELAKKVARLDPYTYTLEGLRTKIASLIEECIKKKKDH